MPIDFFSPQRVSPTCDCQLPQSLALQGVISHYFWYRPSAPGSSRLAFADGLPKWCFPLQTASPIVFSSPRKQLEVYGGYLSGLFLEQTYVSGLHEPIFGVCFTPLGLGQVLSQPIKLLRHELAWELTDLLGQEAEALTTMIRQATSADQQVSLVEAFLTKRLTDPPSWGDPLTVVMHLIRQSGGQITIGQLGQQLALSYKQTERLVERQLGLCPKELCRLTRFIHTHAKLAESEWVDWLTIALANGFYDLQHLSREWHTFTGYAPSLYQEKFLTKASLR